MSRRERGGYRSKFRNNFRRFMRDVDEVANCMQRRLVMDDVDQAAIEPPEDRRDTLVSDVLIAVHKYLQWMETHAGSKVRQVPGQGNSHRNDRGPRSGRETRR